MDDSREAQADDTPAPINTSTYSSLSSTAAIYKVGSIPAHIPAPSTPLPTPTPKLTNVKAWDQNIAPMAQTPLPPHLNAHTKKAGPNVMTRAAAKKTTYPQKTTAVTPTAPYKPPPLPSQRGRTTETETAPNPDIGKRQPKEGGREVPLKLEDYPTIGDNPAPILVSPTTRQFEKHIKEFARLFGQYVYSPQ